MAHQKLLRSPFIIKALLPLLAVLFVGLMGSDCFADWLIYHKPAFEGQILDGETKEPIEGAAVALYNKRTIGLGAGTLSSVIEIREALTDMEGKFHIPSYTTVIQPFSWSTYTTFLVFKPGYVGVDEMDLEELFSGREVGMSDREFPWIYNQALAVRLRSPNIVELPKVKTREDRRKAKLSPYGEKKDWDKQNKLIKLIRDEWQFLYSKDPEDLYMPKGGLK